MNGPLKLDPKGFLPLMPFSKPSGIEFPVFSSLATWEAVLRYDPVGVMQALNAAIGRALAGKQADEPAINFKHWLPPQGEQRKAHRVRLTASLYQMQESNQIWVLLKSSHVRSGGLSLVTPGDMKSAHSDECAA